MPFNVYLLEETHMHPLKPITLTTQPMIDLFGKTLPAAWIPGTGETPYKTRSGIRVLYCWNRRTGEKAWLNCDTDMFMSDEDAIQAHNNPTPFKQGDIL